MLLCDSTYAFSVLFMSQKIKCVQLGGTGVKVLVEADPDVVCYFTAGSLRHSVYSEHATIQVEKNFH